MFIQILAHTPLWVFGLFVFLIVLGLKQSRARTVNARLIFLLPVGMLILSFSGLVSSFGLNALPVSLWSLSWLLLVYVKVRFFALQGVQYDKVQNTYQIQGSWTPLALIMAIFFTKYFVGVTSALKPNLVDTLQFIILSSVLYGIFSGIFMGKALSAWAVSRREDLSA